jgi:hypothetical protein
MAQCQAAELNLSDATRCAEPCLLVRAVALRVGWASSIPSRMPTAVAEARCEAPCCAARSRGRRNA